MPLLFAATLFVSASLLFMVQPMVGKMVLPLLGGSPAVWNACMVFFQLLLLLGYQYAHFMTGRYQPRRQWGIHLLVLALPVTAFGLAVALGTRHSPIAVVEGLAPGGESNPVLSVLAILAVAIAVPFFVISTSAPLLQKWFTATGHPSARDPYFLYSASNAGSLISLLGYPIFIEPNLTIVGQAWVFAAGFVILAVMIFFCGRAAAHPIGTPPAAAQAAANKAGKVGGGQGAVKVPPAEAPPGLARKAKWVLLAFVPSSLMLGVTFHMTTDIASIPLLWVGPLALYLITFIVVFGTLRSVLQLLVILPGACALAVGLASANLSFLIIAGVFAGIFVALQASDWLGIPNRSVADAPAFRVVIGNLAPVMILLLVFVLISGVNPGYGITLMLHMATFFAAALMCHYELARDRPSPEFLTEFFLLMSVGGVLGGIFNSLVAPLVFPHAYEYPLALIVACLLVPKLGEEDKDAPPPSERRRRIGLALDIAVPVAVGVVYYLLTRLPNSEAYAKTCQGIAKSVGISIQTISIVFIYAVPVMMCFFFVDRPLRFALCVAAILGYNTYTEEAGGALHSERSFFGILKIQENENYHYLRSTRFKLTRASFDQLRAAGVTEPVLSKLAPLADEWVVAPDVFRKRVSDAIGEEGVERYYATILKYAEKEEVVLRQPEGAVNEKGEPVGGTPLVAAKYGLRKLMHGTTLHGTQISYLPGPDGKEDKLQSRHVLDDFQMLFPGGTAWDPIAFAGAIHAYDVREEPLTYYHRTGPVGAMFAELRRRKGGADATAPVAMVGLGTGSVACYAQKGQKLTFYEIDPAVKHLVADTDKYFTYVTDARRRGAEVDLRMGDARLKLKEDTDRKYTLLLVDAFSSDSIPVHLLTVEAVQLYFDRMPEDGMLALHISNRWVRLEPVVAAIAQKLGVTARVWNDDSEGKVGKTASSWIVLARQPEYLGRLYSPLGDLPFAPAADDEGNDRMRYVSVRMSDGNYLRPLMDQAIFQGLVADFPKDLDSESRRSPYDDLNEARDAREAWLGWAYRKYADLADPDGGRRLALFRETVARAGTVWDVVAAERAWLDETLARTAPPELERLKTYIELLDRYGPTAPLQEIMVHQRGHAFRRLELLKQVHAWTDDYADVMRVMSIPELQKVRRFFGLPTPLDRR